MDARGKVGLHNGKVCLCIDTEMRASLKDQCYKCSIVLTNSGLHCCRCTCKEGSLANNRHTDVHCVGVLVVLMLLLFDGLSEHLLVELAAEWISNPPLFATESDTTKAICALCF